MNQNSCSAGGIGKLKLASEFASEWPESAPWLDYYDSQCDLKRLSLIILVSEFTAVVFSK